MQKERRSFSIEIVKCDGFVDMSAEAQALYLQLVMACDDEGFTASTNICKAFAHASDSAEQELIDRKFILQIKGESRKVTVIKHWKTNNYFRDGKAKPSTFAERAQVYVKPNGNYTLDPLEGQPLVSKKQQPLSKRQGSMSKEQTPLSESREGMSASCDVRTGCADTPIPKQSNPSITPSNDSVIPTKQSNVDTPNVVSPIQSKAIQSNPKQSNPRDEEVPDWLMEAVINDGTE